MDIPSRTNRTVWFVALAVGFTLVWATLVIVFGWGASSAHADSGPGDQEPPHPGLSSLVTSVADTAEGAIDAVHTVSRPAADAIQTVAHAATDRATKASATSPVTKMVTEKAADATTRATSPVHKAAHNAIVHKTVAPITDTLGTVVAATSPVVESIEKVPAVGGIVTAVDLNDTLGALATAVVDTADNAATTTDRVIDDTVDAIVARVSMLVRSTTDAGSSVEGALTAPGPISAHASGGAQTSLPSLWAAAVTAGIRSAAAVPVAMISSANAMTRPLSALLSLLSSPGAIAGVSPSTSGPAGAGPGAAALLTAGLFFANRAWMRRGRPGDQQSPSAPVFDTDVSPD